MSTVIDLTASFREYIDNQTRQIQDMQVAQAKADRDEFASDDEVNGFFARYGC